MKSFADVVFGAGEVVIYKKAIQNGGDSLTVSLQTRNHGDQAYQDMAEFLSMKGAKRLICEWLEKMSAVPLLDCDVVVDHHEEDG